MNDRFLESMRQSYHAGMNRDPQLACLEDEVLVAWVMDGKPVDAGAASEDHLVNCAICLDKFRVLHRLHERASEGLRKPGHRPWPYWRLAGFAAAILMAALGFSLVWPLTFLGEGPLNGVGDAPRYRGETALIEPEPGRDATLAAQPDRLALAGLTEAGDGGFQFAIFSQQAEMLWQSQVLATPAAEISSASRAALPGEGSFYWTCTLIAPGEPQRLGPFWFTVAPAREADP